jgi:hypothetical protein
VLAGKRFRHGDQMAKVAIERELDEQVAGAAHLGGPRHEMDAVTVGRGHHTVGKRGEADDIVGQPVVGAAGGEQRQRATRPL